MATKDSNPNAARRGSIEAPKAAITFELSPTLKAKLARQAKKENRSVSYLVRQAVEKMLEPKVEAAA